MKNTYVQAAEKMGIKVGALKKMVYRREIGIIDMGHRTKLITDAEIARINAKRTREAIR